MCAFNVPATPFFPMCQCVIKLIETLAHPHACCMLMQCQQLGAAMRLVLTAVELFNGFACVGCWTGALALLSIGHLLLGGNI